MAHTILISPIGYRDPDQIHRIIREKSRVQGPMGSIVEWQSLKTQEYRYMLLVAITRFWELFGLRRPVRFEKPVAAGEYEDAVQQGGTDHSFLSPYLEPKQEPRLGGKPSETTNPEENPPE
jgi:hypothetical protein